MTSELRPAVEVWRDAAYQYGGLSIEGGEGESLAAAVIEADREAVRAEQAAEVAKWRDKYNELGQMTLEQVSDLGTKLGRTETELDAAKADLQGANRELAKFKALAETLAGALHHRGGPLCPARYYGDAQCTCGVAEALRQYKEACHD